MSQHSSRGHAWEQIRQRILARDGYSCVVCGNAATTVDHIIPRSRGGTDEEHNLQAMCQTHNLKKGSRLVQRGTYWLEEVFPNGLPTPKNGK